MKKHSIYAIEDHRVTGLISPDGEIRSPELNRAVAKMVDAMLLTVVEAKRQALGQDLEAAPTDTEALAAANAITEQLSVGIANLTIGRCLQSVRPEEISESPATVTAVIEDALTPRPRAQWHNAPADKQEMPCKVVDWNGLFLALQWEDGSVNIAPKSEVETFS